MSAAATSFRTIDDIDCAGKRVLLRADLNVPVREGKITDLTRLERLVPTIRELSEKGARVIVVSHFDRPKGRRVPEMSLEPVSAALAAVLGHPVMFAHDCIGPDAEAAVAVLKDGDVLVLENTRYHAGEEANDPELALALSKLADIYVNDAFSAAHRAHASTEGVARHLPSHAGRLMQAELDALTLALENPERPVGAVIGGAKISTKLDLIGNILAKVDVLIIGGAMANTFLAAKGVEVGKSLQEAEMHDTARAIMAQAEARGCRILLPVDAVVAREFKANAANDTVAIDAVPADTMILDAGPLTVAYLAKEVAKLRTLVWNGPLGAFEIAPFDVGTNTLARAVAALTKAGTLRSVAGGGDTVSALRHAGVVDQFSYVSTAGGAFLEWLEGKALPGIQALTSLRGIALPT
ncbi:phosphoglycerate kinase [Lichenicola cladoniae]|uniref:Phosphoglycerate kinase n=1 Tax=Lichenicola cladoniae TaxID=1484109 RepID=A0A6M8HS85_9PROT|nr:phosphoglycerate kinase [Lichenicola cladoniae]NPD65797.1 phosphoglycerate kinase [Acetobacteraceae bacterium]QKE91192.1 phosphoglycerate kinase [Lichenicola cladoniae]